MKKYELMVILKPMLPEDIRAGILQRVDKLVKTHKGKIDKTDTWGKRHLAYAIKKHEEGYYVIYQLAMEAGEIAEFQKQLKLMADVLRFLLTVLD